VRIVDALRTPIWQRLIRRLYPLALASLALSIATPVLIAHLTAPSFPDRAPPTPLELEPLRAVIDDVHARDSELLRLEHEQGLHIAVFDDAGSLVASTGSAASPALLPHAPPGPGRFAAFARGHGPPLAVPMTSPSGHSFFVTLDIPGPPELLSRIVVSLVVVLLLLVATVFFAAILAVPLAELARATSAFGNGDTSVRADVGRAGAFSSLAFAFNDMAERVTLLMRAERELLANVSHELRTPLARIRVALDIAEVKDWRLDERSMAGIARDLKELETLVDDVLTTALLDTSVDRTVPTLRLKPVHIDALLESSAVRFRTLYPSHVLDVRVVDAGRADLDAVLARRALDNVLDNAGKYSEPRSHIALEARIAGDNIAIVVEDNGIGISDDDQRHLFTPFFRGDKSRDRKTGGIGLGLALARRIARGHGGDVSIVSELGRGTTVTLVFPRTSLPVQAGEARARARGDA
jgi:signal transduction histidine kinase